MDDQPEVTRHGARETALSTGTRTGYSRIALGIAALVAVVALGLAATVVAVVFATRAARRALEQELD